VAVTPVTLVTGVLAAGKTTAIRRWCAGRPRVERWAVLVNDFGRLAIDAAAHSGVEVFEVAGGCACCAAVVAMRATLSRILRRGPWDRLVVELSGLGHPAQMIDLLRDAARAMPVRIDGVVAVVDGSRPGPWLTMDRSASRDLARAQVDAADLVVLNRPGDGAARDTLVAALAHAPFGTRPVLVCDADGLPWERILATIRQAARPVPEAVDAGVSDIPDARGDSPRTRAPEQSVGPMAAGTRVSGPMPVPIGVAGGGRRWRLRSPQGFGLAWQWPADAAFDRRALLRWTERVGRLPGLLRAKGVFRTQRDWYFWQHAPDRDTWEPSGWRADIRVECLFSDPFDPVALERGLLEALDDGTGTAGT
jgi:G3E family GTPase